MSTYDQSLDLDLRLPITAWFNDESLYSLCCRYHYVSGNALAGRSAQQLFGHSRHGTQHDFPSRIHVFAQRTQTLFGTPEEIIRTRTVLPLFLPWKSPQEAHQLMAMFCAGKASKIKSLLGLLASRMRAHLPLKACPQCIQEDRQRVGVAYWHLTHQLPGVWVCLDHGCALLESTKKSNGVGRFLWTLPHENDLYEASIGPLNPESIKQRYFLAKIVVAAFQLPKDTHLIPDQLLQTYRHALGRHGLLRGHTQIALEHAAEHYLEFIGVLDGVIPELTAPSTIPQARQALSRLLHPCARPTHLLRHLLIILWLFKHWDAFWSTYLECSQTTKPEHLSGRVDANSKTSVALTRAEFLQHIQNRKLTITQASKLVGVSPQTGQAWASASGMHINRRSKLARSTIKAIIKDLHSGNDKEKIAQTHQVSLSTITRLLRTEPHLPEIWHRARFTARQNAARLTWTRAISTFPDSPLKDLRARHPGCYAWLYRNDRQWLIESKTRIKEHQRKNQSPVDWHARDKSLVKAVEKAHRHVAAQLPPNKPATLQQLYQAAPVLKPFINKLDRLPQTKRAIDKARHREATIKRPSTNL